jgi:hypothetical protein
MHSDPSSSDIDTTRQTEAEARAERRRMRSRANQMQRAVAAVDLAVDALSAIDRLVLLNSCLRNALDDAARPSR